MPSAEYVTAAHATCNPQGAKLLVAFDRGQMPVWLNTPAGAVVPVQGSRSAGKSTLLESIAQLNPQLSTLAFEGSGGASGEPPSVERTRALLDSVKNPAHTLVLIDDLQYLQPAVSSYFWSVAVSSAPCWSPTRRGRGAPPHPCWLRSWDARVRFCSHPHPWRMLTCAQ